MKTRKHFAFDAETIEKGKMKAVQSGRSLTKYIEMLIKQDLKKHHDEFFDHMDKRK